MRSSRTIFTRSLAVTAALGLCLGTASPAAAGDDRLLRDGFEGSVPDGPTIAGVDPGGAPWVLDDDESEVRVREDGRIRVELDDLVIPGRGNPVAMMTATLVCDGSPVSSTHPFAVDAEGDARFRGTIWVPDHCDDPQVLIRHAVSGAYFAFTDDEHEHHD